MTEIRVRAFTEDDTEAALRLVAASLGPGSVPRTAEFWRWKHVRNPFGPSPGLVAEDAGELVALRMFLTWRVRGSEGAVRVVRAVDTATAPAYRSKGLFRKLTMDLIDQLRDQGVGFVFNTPNEVSRRGYLKMGWQDLGRVPVRIKILRPARALFRLLGGSRDSVPAAIPPWPEKAAALLARTADSAFRDESRWHTDRITEYFAWRYQGAPSLAYGLSVSGNAAASVVWRRRSRGRWNEAAVAELLSAESSDGVEALRSMCSVCDADYAIALATPGTEEDAILARSGFRTIPRQGPFFTTRSLARSAPASRADWRLSVGDLEVF